MDTGFIALMGFFSVLVIGMVYLACHGNNKADEPNPQHKINQIYADNLKALNKDVAELQLKFLKLESEKE